MKKGLYKIIGKVNMFFKSLRAKPLLNDDELTVIQSSTHEEAQKVLQELYKEKEEKKKKLTEDINEIKDKLK